MASSIVATSNWDASQTIGISNRSRADGGMRHTPYAVR